MQTVPLHNHSEFSVFDGMATVDEITDRVKEIGSEHVALTDHGVVSGHIAFNKACDKAGLHPIFGMEAYQARTHRTEKHRDGVIRNKRPKRDAFHLVLLAETNKGLKNLWTLSSLAHATGFYNRARVDWELLEEYHDGIIATSACLGGYVADDITHERTTALDKYIGIFGSDNFYLELHTYDTDYQREVNLALVDLSRRYGLPVVYATDAHYACRDDYDMHEAMITIAQHTVLEDEDRMTHPPSLWIQDEQGIRDALSYLPKSVVDEAIQNSELIANRCTAELPKPKRHVPKFDTPDGQSEMKYLVDLVKRGAVAKGIFNKPEYVERAMYELGVIERANLADFFLITQDITSFARENQILVGPGRGSAAGSLVAYLLGITDVDPLRYGLIFERFYNAGREKGGLPDIDIDFPASKRDVIKQYVAEKYGKDNVAAIGTTLRLHAKSTIDRVNTLLHINDSDILAIKRIVDEQTKSGLLASWDKILQVAEIQPYIEKHPQLFEMVGELHGRIFASGVHASGYLIADEPLHGVFPLKWNAQKEELSTQFDMKEAEQMGFMKNDFLGLGKLDVLEEFQSILNAKGIHFPFDIHEAPDKVINIEEAEMWKMLHNGFTTGVFQIEDGRQAKDLTKRMKPSSVEELAVLVALNRPGPINAGYADAYIERKNGLEWEHIDPILADVLDETYGVFVFQEQVIKFVQKLGYNPEEADNVRRIMGKKKPEEMAALHPEYMERATKLISSEAAQEIWDGIVGFSEYAFNKSHAVCYAIIGLWTLYAKHNFPGEFLLASIRRDPDATAAYIDEAMRFKINVRGPDINKSGMETDLVDGEIVYGLRDVKNVKTGVEWVIENRPFESFDHLMEKLEAQNEAFLERKKNGETEEGARSPKQIFGAGKIKALYNAGAFDALEERQISKIEKRKQEKELLGVVISNDAPLIIEKHRAKIEASCDPFDEVKAFEGEHIIAGIISKVERKKTRNNTTYLRLTIQYDGDSIGLSVFGNKVEKFEHVIAELVPVIAEVKTTSRGINLERIKELK